MRGVQGSGVIGRFLGMAAAACVASGWLTPAVAQTQPAHSRETISGAPMNGFGRMILSLKEMTKASAQVSSGILIVAFDNPVTVDPEKIALELPDYVSAARRDPDGKALRFALVRPLRPHLKEAGEKLYLDLLPERWTGQPPGLPQDVVDDLARRARQAEEALRKSERLRVANDVRSVPVRVGSTPVFTRLVFELPPATPLQHALQPGRIEINLEGAFKFDSARLKAQAGEAVKGAEQSTSEGRSNFLIEFPENWEGHGFREDDTFVLDLSPPEAREKRQSPELPPAPLRAEAAQPSTAVAPSAQTPPPQVAPRRPVTPIKFHGPARPDVARDGDTIRIALPFAGRPPAAAFDRHGVVTLLFETAQEIELGDTPDIIREAGGVWISTTVAKARVVRIAFSEPKLVRLAPEGDGWVATIGDRLAAASDVLAPKRTLDLNGRMIMSIGLQGAAGVHWLDDADTGERIAVAPATEPLRSMPRAFQFSEFELLATAHGVAIVAFADDLTVRADLEEVVIERSAGLSVTSAESRASDMAARLANLAFERGKWDALTRGTARDVIRGLEASAADLARAKRTPARIALARAYFIHGLYSESAGVAQLTVAEDTDAQRDRELAILRVASAIQMRRLDDARSLLGQDILRDDPEADAWRAILEARQRNWPRAMAGFVASQAVIAAYPEALQATMRELHARAAVETRNFGAALAELDALDRLDRELVRQEEASLLRARVDEAQGRLDDAFAAYKRIYEGKDREAAAEAGLRAALIGLDSKAMTREAAIARLETVSAVWRGDGDIEPETISALGRLYAEDYRWRDAFATARRGNTIYPNHEKMRTLHDYAANLFEAIFVDGKGDSIDRVQALALFHDFKEFVPPGARGDEIVRRLAERLVQLDLLDGAADLLQHQIDHRLTGQYRSALAARLAVIYLMNRKSAAALATLKATRLAELPWRVKRARALLEARALSDLSRTDLALEIIASEDGPDVDRLAADIQWQGRRWRAAGETYERILGDRWKDRTALDERARSDVIRAAAAYALADEPLATDRMRGKFGAAMANSADARAFRLLTSPAAARAGEFRELARHIARADTLGEFLEEYRKRYPDIPPRQPKRDETSRPQAGAEPKASTPGQG